MPLGELKRALRLVAEGSDFSDGLFQSLKFSSDDPVIGRAANDAWNVLRRFVSDEDIRAKDQEYDRSQREVVRRYLDEIEALERGEDPRGRRLTWLARWARRLGLSR